MNICPEMFILRADSIAPVIVQWGLYSQTSLPTLLSKHGPYSLPLPLSALNPVGLAALQQRLKIACSLLATGFLGLTTMSGFSASVHLFRLSPRPL